MTSAEHLGQRLTDARGAGDSFADSWPVAVDEAIDNIEPPADLGEQCAADTKSRNRRRLPIIATLREYLAAERPASASWR